MTTTARHIVTGDGPPTAPPPGIAAHYVDKLTGTHYLAKGTLSPSDWILLGADGLPDGGSPGDVLTLTDSGASWSTPSPVSSSSVNVVIL